MASPFRYFDVCVFFASSYSYNSNLNVFSQNVDVVEGSRKEIDNEERPDVSSEEVSS